MLTIDFQAQKTISIKLMALSRYKECMLIVHVDNDSRH